MKERPKWYLDPRYIRRKVRHSWTEQELKTAYLLRTSGESVDNIIKDLNLNVDRVQVYNIIRMFRSSLKKVCIQCSNPLSDQEQLDQAGMHFPRCAHCRKINQKEKDKIRGWFERHKLCIYCGKAQRKPGKKSCIRCLSATHRRRAAKGICGRCNTNPISDISTALCNSCLKLNRVYAAQYREQNRPVEAL